MFVGCGYNAFKQLSSTTERFISHPVPLFSDTDSQNARHGTNSGNFKVVIKWSSIHLLKDQQVICSSMACPCCLRKQTEDVHQDSIIDVDLHANAPVYVVTSSTGLNVVNEDSSTKRVTSIDGDFTCKNVSVGDTYVIAIKGDGSCGQVLSMDSTYIYHPISLSKVCHVTCGKEHVLMLTEKGEVYSFGIGSRGQLGHGLTDTEKEPRIVEALQGIRMAAVSCGGWHSAALSDIGDIYVWGWNETGQLGFPMKPKPMFTMQSTQPNIETDSCKSQEEFNSESRETDMKLICCESEHETHSPNPTRIKLSDKLSSSLKSETTNYEDALFTEVGEESSRDIAIQFAMLPSLLDFPGDISVSKVSCGLRHSAAVLETGELYTWGWGKYGQLGHGNTETVDRPTHVTTLQGKRVTDVICGGWNTVVVYESLLSQSLS